MSDAVIRERTASIPIPEFSGVAFITPPPLRDCKVAIVTSAGLQKIGDEIWKAGDQSYRVFDRADRDLTSSHLSNNFDRSGLVADLNVAYPIDRLEELAELGVIGSVAPRHVSFMGALDETMSTLRRDHAPAVAKLLVDDGVDVALLTPV